MTAAAPVLREHGNAYNIFILVLTIFSLALMVLLVMPWVDPETRQLLNVYDNAACVIFLDRLRLQHHGRQAQVGVLHPPAGLARPARVDPELRILPADGPVPPRPPEPPCPHPQADGRPEAQAARRRRAATTAASTRPSSRSSPPGIVLCVSSILVLQFESRSPDANITTGGDALWWAVVTITTVGYGDYYPVTTLGRADRRVGDVRGRRDHRRPRQHPGQHPRAAAQADASPSRMPRPRRGRAVAAPGRRRPA